MMNYTSLSGHAPQMEGFWDFAEEFAGSMTPISVLPFVGDVASGAMDIYGQQQKKELFQEQVKAAQKQAASDALRARLAADRQAKVLASQSAFEATREVRNQQVMVLSLIALAGFIGAGGLIYAGMRKRR